ncbi:small nuclear ribonucleoprotein Sm D2 isoform X3 [Haemorhous mexicanus]|uniref:small nuclear ribonucleoprotein Sm D2 isoform X3 n=1 Tax=Haemorhous mexicanus TaxID=30427 RepID=UPI0028BF21ED|nr:small nuclear ribonucleoprotein Sm D2 isoform X3 [Haemorhous mexicanus]
MDVPGTFQNLPEPSRIFPEPSRTSQSDSVIVVLHNPLIAGKLGIPDGNILWNLPEPSQNLPRTILERLRHRRAPQPPHRWEIGMDRTSLEPSRTFRNHPSSIPGTFQNLQEPSQNLPRAIPSSSCSATPSSLGGRDGRPWNLPEPSGTTPDPSLEPSRTFPEPSRTIPKRLRHRRAPQPPHRWEIGMDVPGTFQNLPRTFRNHPRATPSSSCSAIPSSLGSRDGRPWNLPEPSGTTPEPSRTIPERLRHRRAPQPPHRWEVEMDILGTFQNRQEPPQLHPWNLPEPSRTFPEPSRTIPEQLRHRRAPQPPHRWEVGMDVPGTFQNLQEPSQNHPWNLPEPPQNLPEPSRTIPERLRHRRAPQPPHRWEVGMDIPGTFQNLPEPSGTTPDPSLEPSRTTPEPSRTIPERLRHRRAPQPAHRWEIEMDIHGTFQNLPRSLRTFQNHPRATPSSSCSATPSSLGSRDGHPWNLPEPSRTFRNHPRSIPGTFQNLPEPPQIHPWNLPEPSQNLPEPSQSDSVIVVLRNPLIAGK